MSSRIAVTARMAYAEGYHEVRDAVSHDWVRFLDRNRLAPVMVPNCLEDPVRFVEQAGVGALLLTNGEDVHPSRFGGPERPSVRYAPERDETEFALLKWGLERGLPILCVCRGFQLANVYFGGTIVLDVGADPRPERSHVATEHEIEILDEATRTLAGARSAVVNSYHRHGITRSALGKQLTPFAQTRDGVIEGYYRNQAPLLGIQWHPEREGPDNFCQKELAAHFLHHGPWWF